MCGVLVLLQCVETRMNVYVSDWIKCSLYSGGFCQNAECDCSNKHTHIFHSRGSLTVCCGLVCEHVWGSCGARTRTHTHTSTAVFTSHKMSVKLNRPPYKHGYMSISAGCTNFFLADSAIYNTSLSAGLYSLKFKQTIKVRLVNQT